MPEWRSAGRPDEHVAAGNRVGAAERVTIWKFSAALEQIDRTEARKRTRSFTQSMYQTRPRIIVHAAERVNLNGLTVGVGFQVFFKTARRLRGPSCDRKEGMCIEELLGLR
jgi:hypothetical protein